MCTLRNALITAWAGMALVLAGCGGESSVSTKELEAGTAKASPVFKPSASQLPFPTDLTRNGTADGSVNIPVQLDTNGDGVPDTPASNVNAATAPAAAELADPQVALNTMDGFGTTSAISVSFTNPINPQTLRGNIRVFKPADTCDPDGGGAQPDSCNLPMGASAQFPLGTNLGVDVATKTVIAVGEELEFGKDFFINNAGTSGAFILPMKPLDPGETYLVVVTDGVKSAAGNPVTPSEEYALTKGGTTLPNATLEQIRQRVNQHESAVVTFTDNTPSSDDIAKEDIALSFGFTTENIGGALQSAKGQVDGAGTAPSFNVHNEDQDWPGPDVDGDGNPGDFALVSPGTDGIPNAQDDHAAHIYLGTLNDTVQFLDPANPNTGLWKGEATAWAATSLPQLNNGDELENVCSTGFGGSVDSENLVPCNGFTPAEQAGSHSIPVMISAPRTEILNSSFDIPGDDSSDTYDCSALQGGPGLPVVIYQHGITTSRATTLAIADALAKACIVGVAIDLPKHGIKPTNDPFGASQLARAYQGFQLADGISQANLTSERLVTVSSKDECQDPENATGVDPANPDSAPFYCPSGDRYINLENLANARDVYRQGIVDLFSLVRGLKDNPPGTDQVGANINEGSVHFAGVSLGAITGVPFVANASADIETATFNVGSGGIAKTLDGSPEFEPRITAGLAENDVFKPSSSYEGFMLIAQTLFDNADPMNFADTLGGGGIPVLYQEVVGETQMVGADCSSVPCPDQVVPNNVFGQTALTDAWKASTFSNQISFLPGQSGVTQPSALAGTDPLTQGTAFFAQAQQGILDPVPGTQSPDLFYGLGLQQVDASGGSGSGLVRFNAGSHGSLLDPSTNLAVTSVMQTQLATFVGSYVQSGGAGTSIAADPNAGSAAQVVQD